MGRTLATCKSCQERFDVFSGHTCPNGFRDFSQRATAIAAAIVEKKNRVGSKSGIQREDLQDLLSTTLKNLPDHLHQPIVTVPDKFEHLMWGAQKENSQVYEKMKADIERMGRFTKLMRGTTYGQSAAQMQILRDQQELELRGLPVRIAMRQDLLGFSPSDGGEHEEGTPGRPEHSGSSVQIYVCEDSECDGSDKINGVLPKKPRAKTQERENLPASPESGAEA